MKYFIYCRKSSEGDEKQALSLQAQERELKQYAREKMLIQVEVFQESKSARIPGKRIKFLEMIEKIKSGEADGILCWHTNRLSRNPQESGLIMQLLTDGIIREIVTPQRVIDSNSSNDILLGVEFGSNSQYSKELSYNTKRGIREKIILGQYPSYAPAFYVNYGLDNKSKNIKPDPRIAHFYPQMVDKVINDRLNLPKVTMLLKSWGVTNRQGKYYSKSNIHRFLRNPVYYGLIKYSNYPERMGSWEPLITKERWDELQNVLDDRTKPIQSKREYAYNRLIKCGKCGLSITGYTKVKKSGKVYRYYGCTKRNGNCGNPPMKEVDLELQIREQIRSIQIDHGSVNHIKVHTLELLDREFSGEKQKRAEVSAKLERCSERLDKLLTMRIEDEITKDEYTEKKEEVNDEVQQLKSQLSDQKYNRDFVRQRLELFFDEIFNLELIFSNGTYEEKNLIVHRLTEDLILTDKQIGWNFKKPWSELVVINSGTENINWGHLLDQFINLKIDFKVNINNIKYLLSTP